MFDLSRTRSDSTKPASALQRMCTAPFPPAWTGPDWDLFYVLQPTGVSGHWRRYRQSMLPLSCTQHYTEEHAPQCQRPASQHTTQSTLGRKMQDGKVRHCTIRNSFKITWFCERPTLKRVTCHLCDMSRHTWGGLIFVYESNLIQVSEMFVQEY